jgi:hypothetical protein
MDILYAPLFARGYKINEWNIRYNCLLKKDLSGCLPCSKNEGQETADQINAIASFAKTYLNVMIKVVSQGGRSTNVFKYCVKKLQDVNVILPNGYHISLPGYRNPRVFDTIELQVYKLTSDIRQISIGLEESSFLTNAVMNPSLLIAEDEHGMSFDELYESWKKQSYRKGMIARAGGKEKVLAAFPEYDNIDDVPIEDITSMAQRQGMIDRAGGEEKVLAAFPEYDNIDDVPIEDITSMAQRQGMIDAAGGEEKVLAAFPEYDNIDDVPIPNPIQHLMVIRYCRRGTSKAI